MMKSDDLDPCDYCGSYNHRSEDCTPELQLANARAALEVLRYKFRCSVCGAAYERYRWLSAHITKKHTSQT